MPRKNLGWHIAGVSAALTLCGRLHAAEPPDARPAAAPLPEWKAMDYGPFLSASLEVEKGNIANKGVAIRLDPGPGGVARGREFFLFETDTLRAAAVWTGPEFIDWRNIAFDGAHEVHASILGDRIYSNGDAPGWAAPDGSFTDQRIVGRDGSRYGPLPRDWGHWHGLYVHGDRVVLSYELAGTSVLESPSAAGPAENRHFTRTFNIGPRARPLLLQVASAEAGFAGQLATNEPAQSTLVKLNRVTTNTAPGEALTNIRVVGGPAGLVWNQGPGNDLRLTIPAGVEPIRFALVFSKAIRANSSATPDTLLAAPEDLTPLTHGGPSKWPQRVTTKMERIFDPRPMYSLESISVPAANPFRSWMRLGGFDFLGDGRQAAVCTWQGDVWLVDGLGGDLSAFTWRRIAAGMFQPLGLKVIDGNIYVTCRDQITILRDLNADGETDFYENFNNDAQVTEHFHEFAMDLQTDAAGNLYYTKGGRHAKDALVPQHGTLLRVSKDGQRTQIVASGFRAPNGVCVNGDGTFVISDQEGHWTPENRINWVREGGFYGYMMGYHSGRSPDDFEPPLAWVHKTLDRSPAEGLWVASDRWGLPRGSLIFSSYGTGKLLLVLSERIGGRMQGGVMALPIAAAPTGIMRCRFNPADGQLYAAGLFGWASDKTKAGGFYRIRYTGKPLDLPASLRAASQGIVISFTRPLEPETALDRENYAVSRWSYRRTANYGSDDFKLSQKDQRGRDSVDVTNVKLSPDHKTVLLQIADMQPCMQMEIRYNLRSADGSRISQVIQNTIHAVGRDLPDELAQ